MGGVPCGLASAAPPAPRHIVSSIKNLAGRGDGQASTSRTVLLPERFHPLTHPNTPTKERTFRTLACCSPPPLHPRYPHHGLFCSLPTTKAPSQQPSQPEPTKYRTRRCSSGNRKGLCVDLHLLYIHVCSSSQLNGCQTGTNLNCCFHKKTFVYHNKTYTSFR